MLETRVIPCLLLKNRALVKTVKFKNPSYIGDPINTVRIFNEEGVDELVFLDTTATLEKKQPNFDLIRDIASECFMPVAYGGGITSIQDMKKIFGLGVEKIVVNTLALENPELIRQAADQFGSQSIVVSMDVKKNIWGCHKVFKRGGLQATAWKPADYARYLEKTGAGEILLTSIDRDGTWEGYDLELIKKTANTVQIPVIACGGAGKISDFSDAVKIGGASAVAAGSMVVYQGKGYGVLINFPDRSELQKALSRS